MLSCYLVRSRHSCLHKSISHEDAYALDKRWSLQLYSSGNCLRRGSWLLTFSHSGKSDDGEAKTCDLQKLAAGTRQFLDDDREAEPSQQLITGNSITMDRVMLTLYCHDSHSPHNLPQDLDSGLSNFPSWRQNSKISTSSRQPAVTLKTDRHPE